MTTNLYPPPDSDLHVESSEGPVRVKLGKFLSWCSLLMLFSLLGTSQTVLTIVDIFQTVRLTGVGDPKVMAGNISQALVPMVQWLFLAIPGFILALFAIYLSSYRSRVFFNLWKLSAFSLIIAFPFGTVFGLVFSVILFIKRAEFK